MHVTTSRDCPFKVAITYLTCGYIKVATTYLMWLSNMSLFVAISLTTLSQLAGLRSGMLKAVLA